MCTHDQESGGRVGRDRQVGRVGRSGCDRLGRIGSVSRSLGGVSENPESARMRGVLFVYNRKPNRMTATNSPLSARRRPV